MSRFDDLLPGSFRGISFGVLGHESEGGRRLAKFEYPERDLPYNEDLGRRARAFSVRAFVVGDDWKARRDALVRAAEAKGPGELTHPWHGSLQVVCEKWKVSEDVKGVGYAEITLQFVEDGENRFPSAEVDTRAAVAAAAAEARDALADDLADRLDMDGPGWIADDALGRVSGLAGYFEDMAGTDAGYLSAIGEVRSNAPAWIRDGAALAVGIFAVFEAGDALFRGATGTVLAIKAGVVAVINAPMSIRSALGQWWAAEKALAGQLAWRRLSDLGTGRIDASPATPSRAQIAENAAALDDFVRGAALCAAAESAAAAVLDPETARQAVAAGAVSGGDGPVVTADDALALRDALCDRLDMAAETASDDVHAALATLRTALSRDLAARAIALPLLRSHVEAATVPAVVLAHRLYGDVGRADELVKLNRVRHPGFVPGGAALAVRADA